MPNLPRPAVCARVGGSAGTAASRTGGRVDLPSARMREPGRATAGEGREELENEALGKREKGKEGKREKGKEGQRTDGGPRRDREARGQQGGGELGSYND